MKKNSMLKLLSLVLCFVLFAAAALCIGNAETVQEPVANEEVAVQVMYFTFQVIDGEGNETVITIYTDKTTVGEALLNYRMIDGVESAYGLYVKSVLGIVADWDIDQTYWAFYINGEYAMTGVDSTNIENGAVYTFCVAK